jgi:small multidrug resistance family-3 protein
MNALRTVAILLAAAAAEIGGTYAIWRWRRESGPAALVALGLGLLLAYALVQTLHVSDRYGRVYAAYAGVFLIGAMAWGWGVDGRAPDRFDVIGGVIALAGVVVILAGRTIFR